MSKSISLEFRKLTKGLQTSRSVSQGIQICLKKNSKPCAVLTCLAPIALFQQQVPLKTGSFTAAVVKNSSLAAKEGESCDWTSPKDKRHRDLTFVTAPWSFT